MFLTIARIPEFWHIRLRWNLGYIRVENLEYRLTEVLATSATPLNRQSLGLLRHLDLWTGIIKIR
jgi:hypothetical protein